MIDCELVQDAAEHFVFRTFIIAASSLVGSELLGLTFFVFLFRIQGSGVAENFTCLNYTAHYSC
jgi:hypothetical protein